MKLIEPVSIWNDGSFKEATILNAYAINVCLNNSATFAYSLIEFNPSYLLMNTLSQGVLTMTGDDYKKWAADSYAWDWVAEQLNLTITGEYVQPVPPEPLLTEIESPAV